MSDIAKAREWDNDRHGPLTAAKLRMLADWLDLGDRAFETLGRLRGWTDTPSLMGSNVQDDVRYWARCIESGVSPIAFDSSEVER
jgi:hypothetical protein